MNSFRFLLVVMTATLLFEKEAAAAYSPELYAYFDRTITDVQSSVKVRSEDGKDPISALVIQDLDIDLIPTVSFGLGKVASLAISPEIDFVLVPDSQ